LPVQVVSIAEVVNRDSLVLGEIQEGDAVRVEMGAQIADVRRQDLRVPLSEDVTSLFESYKYQSDAGSFGEGDDDSERTDNRGAEERRLTRYRLSRAFRGIIDLE
jgi:hypothetical protein